MSEDGNRTSPQEPRFTILDLNYVSLYYEDFQAAIDFYTKVFEPAENVDDPFGVRIDVIYPLENPGS